MWSANFVVSRNLEPQATNRLRPPRDGRCRSRQRSISCPWRRAAHSSAARQRAAQPDKFWPKPRHILEKTFHARERRIAPQVKYQLASRQASNEVEISVGSINRRNSDADID